MSVKFLPVSQDDLKKRGWGELDIILVTGDAYVDHPSYGASLIGRVLEHKGFRVGIIAQPDWRTTSDFMSLGRPGLFFGVTSGNLDSMIANYTANQKIRSDDDYSPGGRAGMRPDRATIMYTNKIREAFPGIPVVLGGLEASLRRLAHYDYWSDSVRRSVLLDSKADILVYGMGEKQIVEIASRMKNGAGIKDINDIRGTVTIRNSIDGLEDHIEIPAFEDISADKETFNKAFRLSYPEFDPSRGKTIVQRHGNRFIVQLPPARPLTTAEMDEIYGLGFARSWHPVYNQAGGVPGYEAVRFSVTSHRGCAGECSFCSLYAHQGRHIQSRSEASILSEIRLIASRHDFKGTITDIGGPTANLYGASCGNWARTGACRARKCLIPKKCDNLKLGYGIALGLWKKALAIPGVKNIFIGSGVRYDLLLDKESDAYFRELCARHISGRLKVAPEHAVDKVLALMNKPRFEVYEKFAERFRWTNEKLRKKQFLVHYFISAHPGATLNDALDLAIRLEKKHIHPEQIQDFIPLPMTISGAIYYTAADPFSGHPVYVAKGRDRTLQRALLQYKDPNNKRYVIEALRRLGKTNLMRIFYKGVLGRAAPRQPGRFSKFSRPDKRKPR